MDFDSKEEYPDIEKKRKRSKSIQKKKKKKNYSNSRSRSRSNSSSRNHRKKSKRSKKDKKSRRSRSRSYSKRSNRSSIDRSKNQQKKKQRQSKFSSYQTNQPQINSERLSLIESAQKGNSYQPQKQNQNPLPAQNINYNPKPGQGLRTLTGNIELAQLTLQQQHKKSTAVMGPDGVLQVPTAEHKHYKHALRIYCGNIPDGTQQFEVEKFIADSLTAVGGCMDHGSPIFSSKLMQQKKCIFFQMRSIEEATTLLELDGIVYQGKPLRLRRSSDYEKSQKVVGVRTIPKLDLSKITIQKIATQVDNSPNKIWIKNIPERYDEQTIINLLQQQGPLKSFHLARDKQTNQSKGYAFCEYQDNSITDIAIQKLNGLKLDGNKILQMQRSQNLQDINAGQANSVLKYVDNFIQIYESQFMGLNDQTQQKEQPQESTQIYQYNKLLELNQEATAILKISNIVDSEIIEEDKEYEELYNDIKSQLQKVGQINQLIIPRLKDGYEESGLGKIYVEYLDQYHTQIARFSIQQQGIKYNGQEPSIEFYDPRKFADQIYL